MKTSAFLLSSALLLAGCTQTKPDTTAASTAGSTQSTTPNTAATEPTADKGTAEKSTDQWPLTCQLNEVASTCRTEPAANDGFTLFFSHAEGPVYTFTPVGPATTDKREMVDSTGTRWLMSGHRSFELEEVGGFGNRISVSAP
ncbi:hypothetical protein [Synechococcus sp. HK01-R]|uniref:hypothetical protein n=1 Tax=Synechococcus sp. HK01-R TaxID=2751171 RepID=UPI001625881E|nr:hypothetical protein [Synechococcus sp. HK01-R]QNG26164.1 hypothetical protein H0O21_07635 [Synechococcus sp. HK01-R]